MHLSLRIFLAYFLLVGSGMLFYLYTTYDQMRPVLQQTSEEALVDMANLLAEFAPPVFDDKAGEDQHFFSAIRRYRDRQLDARIWSRHKTTPNLVVYLTDTDGRVVFHTNPDQIGEDYSHWLDVSRTLKGQYGARTTRSDPNNIQSGTMYVAAPVRYGNGTIGVLTVGQPDRSIQPFLEYARGRILQLGGVILTLSLAFGAALSMWLTRSIRRLVTYVETVRDGGDSDPPVIREAELSRLADSTESMRREIEGKRYVENYVQNLTHEMKSPISAVQGAVEILQETKLPEHSRHRFLENIRDESRRMQRLVDRLLSLATIENQRQLNDVETLNLAELLHSELERKRADIEHKRIRSNVSKEEPELMVSGEQFLIEQAIGNLLDNAIEFCPEGGSLDVTLTHRDQWRELSICNDGNPVPDYALPRLFERFYSLERPDTAKKSTGLGLSFVHEIVQLHGGNVRITNEGSGVRATMRFPDPQRKP